jgi:nitroimidazol reductase NimA-like FMN-containing flavoprotein (pyridoxamine 5'-phosphate oxidase superfamily)
LIVADFSPRSNKSRVRREPQRAHYDAETIHGILDAGIICHIGYVIDGNPYVTPTCYWREGDRVYWHGSSASRMLRAQAKGIPVCLTVTHLDGLIIARSAFRHSINYRSVMAFGHASMITDETERNLALDRFVDRFYPGRSKQIRPGDVQELKAVSLLGMTIEEASAKSRSGPPLDADEDLDLPYWAGVIPVRTLIGEIETDPRTPRADRPQHLAAYAAGAELGDVLANIYDADAAGQHGDAS